MMARFDFTAISGVAATVTWRDWQRGGDGAFFAVAELGPRLQGICATFLNRIASGWRASRLRGLLPMQPFGASE